MYKCDNEIKKKKAWLKQLQYLFVQVILLTWKNVDLTMMKRKNYTTGKAGSHHSNAATCCFLEAVRMSVNSLMVILAD